MARRRKRQNTEETFLEMVSGRLSMLEKLIAELHWLNVGQFGRSNTPHFVQKMRSKQWVMKLWTKHFRDIRYQMINFWTKLQLDSGYQIWELWAKLQLNIRYQIQ